MDVKKAKEFEIATCDVSDNLSRVVTRFIVRFYGGYSHEFTDITTFDLPEKTNNLANKKILLAIATQYAIALGTSYYRLFCPPTIINNICRLSRKQAQFWDIVYTKGIAQTFYENHIDFKDLVSFPYSSNGDVTHVTIPTNDSALVPIGGGKDSIVVIEELKKHTLPLTAQIADYNVHLSVAEVSAIPTYRVTRRLDQQVKNLVKNGNAYIGHPPMSAVYAFQMLYSAVLLKSRYIVVGNERSANYGNTTYQGLEINHQWSKSGEFEKLFCQYIKENITLNIDYFSLLRPLYEIEIVRRFARHTKYHKVFRSCNKNFRQDASRDMSIWCCACPKCAFVFTCMSAFIKKDVLLDIFGKNMYAESSNLPFFKDLLGRGKIKPFECVGTPEETSVALWLAQKRGEYANDQVVQYYSRTAYQGEEKMRELQRKVFSYGDDSNIPNKFAIAIHKGMP